MEADPSRVLTIVQWCGLRHFSACGRPWRTAGALTPNEPRRYGPRAPTGKAPHASQHHTIIRNRRGFERGCLMSKLTPIRIAAVLSLVLGLARVASAEVSPGETITKDNQD